MTTSTRGIRRDVPAPYLRVDNAAKAIEFYAAVFGAVEIVRLVEPNGRVAHAELRFGGADGITIMLSDEYPEQGLLGPRASGNRSVALQMYVDDVDDVCSRATAHGATLAREPALDPFGDRTAKLTDPSGHEWIVATRVETLTPDEVRARFGRFFTEA